MNQQNTSDNGLESLLISHKYFQYPVLGVILFGSWLQDTYAILPESNAMQQGNSNYALLLDEMESNFAPKNLLSLWLHSNKSWKHHELMKTIMGFTCIDRMSIHLIRCTIIFFEIQWRHLSIFSSMRWIYRKYWFLSMLMQLTRAFLLRRDGKLDHFHSENYFDVCCEHVYGIFLDYNEIKHDCLVEVSLPSLLTNLNVTNVGYI